MTITPHHIRPPRQKNESELRYSTRSRYSTLDHEKGKQIKLFDPPLNLEKDYLTKKIKRTVKHYFKARRSSMESYLHNNDDLLKDKDPKYDGFSLKEGDKDRDNRILFNPQFEIENKHKKDLENDKGKEKLRLMYMKSHNPVTNKSFVIVNAHNKLEFTEIEKEKNSGEDYIKEKTKQKSVNRPSKKRELSMVRVDQALQTEENFLSIEYQSRENN